MAGWHDASPDPNAMRFGAPQRLTQLNAKYISGTFSPDGRRVVLSANVDRRTDIYMVRTDGTEMRQLTTGALRKGEGVFYAPCYSPDGTKILCQRSDWFYEEINDIFFMDADGANQLLLTTTHKDIHPTFSPDGSRIAFASARFGPLEICTMRTDGTEVQRLTETTWDRSNHVGPQPKNVWPVFTPDGKRIVYSSSAPVESAGPRWRVWSMGAGGSEQQPITDVAGVGEMPFVSRDGDLIACTLYTGSERTGNARDGFHVLASDGTSRSFLWSGCPRPFSRGACFAPYGRSILFSGCYNERDEHGHRRWQLCVLSAGTGEVSRLTTEDCDCHHAEFIPDGNWLLYSSNLSGAYDLYLAPVELHS